MTRSPHQTDKGRRFRFRAVIALVTSGGVGCGIVTTAHAQTMDYGALQQLFGEPVTTSAIGTPQRVRDVPADMEIITADDIRRSGATDIPGVLSHVLGVDVTRWSVLGADVSVRGYNSPLTPRLLVLIDGRQVYEDDWGHTEWAALPVELSEIRQIEVVQGPNSALFGFNAAGGVINIVTFNPLYDKVNTAAVTVGTQGYRELSAVASDKARDDLGVRLSAGGTVSDDYGSVRNIAASQALDKGTSRDQISADAHWSINAQSELEVQATHAEDNRLTPSAVWIPIFLHYESNSLSSRYTADTKAGIVTATAYSNWIYAALATQYFGLNSTNAYQTQLSVAQLQDEFTLGTDHTFRLTGEFRHNSVNTAPITGGTVSYDIGSFGGMWNWTILPSLSFTAAGRADELWLGRNGGGLEFSPFTNADWARQYFEPSYNIGLVWHPLELDRFRVTAGRGIQLPSLLELGGFQNLGVPAVTLNGFPGTLPTIVNNVEVDWDHDIRAWTAQLRVAGFYQTTENAQGLVAPFNTVVTPNGSILLFAGNIVDSSEVGAEISLKGRLGTGWRWSMGYTPRIVRDRFKTGASAAMTGVDFAHVTPRHVFDASLGWTRGAWEIDGFLRMQSSAAALVLIPPASFALTSLGMTMAFDSRIAYHITEHLTATLIGQNVLFSSARQNGWSKTEQQVLCRLTANL